MSSDNIESDSRESGNVADTVETAKAPEPQELAIAAEQDLAPEPPLSLLAKARQEASGSRQQELPFAFVAGKAVTDLPKDLYIPPDALEVFLEAFEGPLDLLLYLIKRQNVDILDINVAEITAQYIAYVELMEASQFELAAEYLVMAAMLAEIKSRMLLPRSNEDEEDEEDPRAQLIRRLQEYERYREAAERVDALPRLYRDLFPGSAQGPDLERIAPRPDLDLNEILLAFAEVLRRADLNESHHIQRESLTTRERMTQILLRISAEHFTPLLSLLMKDEGREGVVVTFLAIMELIKESLVELAQTEAFGPIHIRARAA
ncbi:MAG: segregation/condensation protein A [Pseudomonadales bacterium]|jgi:segregation and condensation protein A|nr:segregation/condensation protein A [Pseudomonadales bacterium]